MICAAAVFPAHARTRGAFRARFLSVKPEALPGLNGLNLDRLERSERLEPVGLGPRSLLCFSAKADHRQIGESKQFVRLRRQNGKLMNGVFLLVARTGVHAVHGDHDVIAIHSRCRRRGVKHGIIGRRSGYDQGFCSLVLKKSLEFAAEELIERVGINDCLAFFSSQAPLVRRSAFP